MKTNKIDFFVNKFIDEKKILIAGVVINILFFVCFMQADIVLTARHGMNIWETIVQGKFSHFYEYNLNAGVTGRVSAVCFAMYEYAVYFLFAIWNLPLWLIEHFAKVDVLNSIMGLLWVKAILVPFCLIAFKEFIEISELLGAKKESIYEAKTLLLVSPILVQSVIVMSEYDIIAIAIILIAIKYYLKDDMKKSILFFSLAMPFKYFAAFFLIPLLLYKEKRIIYIILDLIASMWLVIIPRFFMDYEVLSQIGSHSKVFDYVLRNKIPLFYEGVSVFLICAVIWYVYLFFDDKYDYRKIPIVCIISIGILLVCCKTHPQWSLYLLPFLAMAVCVDEKNNDVLVFLCSVLSVGLIIAEIVTYTFVFDTDMIKPMLLSVIKVVESDHALGSGLEQLGLPLDIICELGGTMFIVGLGYFVYTCLTKKEFKISIKKEVSLLVCLVYNVLVYGCLIGAYLFVY